MGFATAGFLARIFRLSLFGHHSLLASPMVGWVRPGATGHPPLSGAGSSVTTGSWFSDNELPSEFWLVTCSGTPGGGTVGAQAPVDDLGLVDRKAVVVGSGQAGRLADRAVDVSDGPARTAHDVVVVVPDASLEQGRAPGRLDAAYQSRRGERVQGLIHRLERDVAYSITDPGGDRLDVEVVTAPEGPEQCDASGRHPQTSTAQHLGGGGGPGRGHGIQPIVVNTNSTR